MEEAENSKRLCENCRRELSLGVDAFAVEQGVIGGRGFIPLEEPRFFCSESCLAGYFDNGETETLRPRIP